MKRLAIKVGEFTGKDGKTKGDYIRLGSIMQSKDGGEYMLLDPSVSLAGALIKQNAYNNSQKKPMRPSLMVSVFDDNRQRANNSQAQNQPPAQQNNADQQQSKGGLQGQKDALDDDIPF